MKNIFSMLFLLLMVTGVAAQGLVISAQSDTSELSRFQDSLSKQLEAGFLMPTADEVVKTTLQVGKATASYKEKNCVQFVQAVLDALFPLPFPKDFVDKVYINHLYGESIAEAVTKKSPSITGIQWAFTSYGLGYEVSREEVQPGDFVQYWYKKKNGSWGGHVAVVMEVLPDGNLRLYSSNLSTGGPAYLNHMKLREHAWFVRLYSTEELKARVNEGGK